MLIEVTRGDDAPATELLTPMARPAAARIPTSTRRAKREAMGASLPVEDRKCRSP
jgi:hypothetical protein